MVKSTPLPNGSVVIRTKRRALSSALLALGILILIACVALALGALFAPASLALVQERALGLVHGGIAARHEQTFVDACVAVPGTDAPQAVTRTRRTTSFGDGTGLEVVFSGKPAPTNAC